MQNTPAISARTRLCAVIGNPIGHSLSPAIHNAAFRSSGLDYVYVAFRVERLKDALAGMRALENFRGLSVTIPHKIEAVGLVDELSAVDKSIGSINTVIREDDGRLRGLGTDGPGALKALRDAGVDIAGKTVLFLGAGGAARAIAFTLAHSGKAGRLLLLDINKDLLAGLSADLKDGAPAMVESKELNSRTTALAMEQADIIINCTPVGMHPKVGVSLVEPQWFKPGQVVFDVVYTPLETKLLRDAAAKGLTVVSGVEMFINQAALQFEQFTGQAAPADVMRATVMRHLEADGK